MFTDDDDDGVDKSAINYGSGETRPAPGDSTAACYHPFEEPGDDAEGSVKDYPYDAGVAFERRRYASHGGYWRSVASSFRRSTRRPVSNSENLGRADGDTAYPDDRRSASLLRNMVASGGAGGEARVDEGRREERGSMHWLTASFISTTFSCGIACVGLPYATGGVGVLLSQVAATMVFGIVTWACHHVFRVVLANPHCRTLGDVGDVTLGRTGRWICSAIQYGNFLGILAVFLNLCTSTMAYVADSDMCEPVLTVILGVSLYGVAQIRQFTRITLAALLSFVAIVAMVVMICYVVITEEPPGPDRAWRYAGNAAGDTKRFMLALATFAWGFTPIFLTNELMQEMEDPRDFKKSLWLSAGCVFFLYVASGVVPVVFWGSDLPNPITELFEESALTRALNFLLFFVSALSFVISVIPLNLAIQRRFVPHLDVDVWSLSTCARFALLSLPAMLFAVAVALFVPDLEDLIGLISTFAIPPGNLVVPAVGLYRYHYGGSAGGGGDGGGDGRPSRLLLGTSLVAGSALSLVTFIGTVWSMADGGSSTKILVCHRQA